MSRKGIFVWLVLPVLVLFAEGAQAVCSSTPCPSTSGAGAINATIMGPVTVASSANLSFGTIVRPATSAGNGTVTISATAANSRSFTGSGLGLGAATAVNRAQFTVTGEGASSVGISTPATLSLTSGGNSLTVTLVRNPSTSPQTLGGSAGSDGTTTIYVGGSFPLTNATVAGAYTGSLTLTASYQ